ncbi:MAG: hypothetical protein ACRDJC_18750 [Thermomicrobiales bacterium]
MAEKAGGIDISCSAVGIEDVQGTPLLEMSLEHFAQPITLAMTTQFLFRQPDDGRHRQHDLWHSR